MFELLEQLGLTKKDTDGSAVFKKRRLVPEKTLRFYIHAAFRLKQFVMQNKEASNFADYSKKYWSLFPKDRIMLLYA